MCRHAAAPPKGPGPPGRTDQWLRPGRGLGDEEEEDEDGGVRGGGEGAVCKKQGDQRGGEKLHHF